MMDRVGVGNRRARGFAMPIIEAVWLVCDRCKGWYRGGLLRQGKGLTALAPPGPDGVPEVEITAPRLEGAPTTVVCRACELALAQARIDAGGGGHCQAGPWCVADGNKADPEDRCVCRCADCAVLNRPTT